MDADSSYGGSDTAQDFHSGHENTSSLETTTHMDNTIEHDTQNNEVTTIVHNNIDDTNNFYHKNEITLPINYDDTDYQQDINNKISKQPHYLSTVNLNINETLEHHNNLEEMNKNYKSTNYLNEKPSPASNRKKSAIGIDNPAFEDERKQENGAVKSTFDQNKPYNGDLNTSVVLGLSSPNKNDEPLAEAVNLELINLKPTSTGGKDVAGPYENGNSTNGMTTIPLKKEADVEIGNPYDEYFVPVNEHRKYMSKTRKGRNSVTFAEMISTADGVDHETGLSITNPERGVLEYPQWLLSLETKRGEKLYVTVDKRNKKKRNKCLCWGICLALVAAAVIIGILAAVGVIGSQDAQPVQEARHLGSNEAPVKAAGGVVFGLPNELSSTTTTMSMPPLTPEPPITTVSSRLPSTETSMIEVPRALQSYMVIDNLQFTTELAQKNSTEYKQLANLLEEEIKKSLFSNDILQFGSANINVKVMEFTPGSVVVKYRITWTFKDGIHNAKDPIDIETLKKRLTNVLNRNSGYINNYYHISDNTVTADKIIDRCQIDNNGCEYKCSFDHVKADFICWCPNGKYLSADLKHCQDEPLDISTHSNVVNLTPSPEPLPESEPKAEPSPEPAPEPTPEPASHPEPSPEPAVEPTPEPAAHPEPSAEPSPESVAHPEPSPEPAAEPTPEPAAQPEPSAEPAAEPTPEPAAQPEPSAEPAAEPTLEPSAQPEPSPELAAEPTPEPTAQPEPSPEPAAEPTPEPAAQPEPSPEPAAEPSPEPSAQPEPSPEPAAEPTPEPAAQPEPSPEPAAEPTPEPTAQPEPSPEPAVDHTTLAETFNKIVDHHNDMSKSEASTEPEPTSELEPASEHVPGVEHTTTLEHYNKLIESNESVRKSDHKPTVEAGPTAETQTTVKTLPAIEQTTKEETLNNEPVIQPLPTTEPSIEPEIEHTSPPLNNRTTTKSTEEPVPGMEFTSPPRLFNQIEPESSTMSQPEHNEGTQPEITSSTQSTVSSEIPKVNVQPSSENSIEPEVTTMEFVEEGGRKMSDLDEIPEKVIPLVPEAELAVTTTQIPLHETSENHKEQEMTEGTTTKTEGRQNRKEIFAESDEPTTTKIIVNNETKDTITENDGTEEAITIPVIVNKEIKQLSSKNSVINNMEPKIYEITTEKHIIIENQAQSTVNHSNLLIEPTENTNNGLDSMSPFLPELENNDTFVNGLHLYEDNTDLSFIHHDDIIPSPPPPPRLDNDQMNVTNPNDDNNSTDTLTVIPLEKHEDNNNEVLGNLMTAITSEITTHDSTTTTLPSILDDGTVDSTTVTYPKSTTTTSKLPETTLNIDSNESKVTTVLPEQLNKTTTEKIELTTLVKKQESAVPSELLNNVHSNSYFEEILERTQNKSDINSNNNVQNFNDFNGTSSTEDLIALETTTIKNNTDVSTEVPMMKNNTKNISETITVPPVLLNLTVISSTEIPKVEENSSATTNMTSTSENTTLIEVPALGTTPKINESTTVHALIVDTVTVNSTFNEETTSTAKSEISVPSHHYEVKEATEDFTTTEKLFLITKPSNPIPEVNQSQLYSSSTTEGLKVIPLEITEENDSKIEQKRVADVSNIVDETNSISSSEEQSVLDKFQIENIDNYNEELSSTIQPTIKESYHYDKINNNNKKNYLGKFNDKKAKLEKTLLDDVKPVTEDFSLTGFSRCATGQFQCINGTDVKGGNYCIPGNNRCDSVQDCTDGSDEIGCEKEGCPNNFQCTSGQCLKRHLVCDGIQNCNDGSDEVNCDKWTCNFDEFNCGEGQRCLPLLWKCDGRRQCPNGNDEYHCPMSFCEIENSFHCLEQDVCIPINWKCDGTTDCSSGEDEKDCECANDEFKCSTGGGCIKLEERCDGTEQCGDKSDEWNCLQLEDETEKNVLKIRTFNDSWSLVCSDNWDNNVHSDSVCQSLGFSRSTSTEPIDTPLNGTTFNGYLKLNANLNGSLWSQLEKTDNCDKVISLTCQEFECGSQSSVAVQSGRIVGANVASENQWPSLALVYDKKRNVQCTATIVAPFWVIASHSCLLGTNTVKVEVEDLVVYAGSTKFMTDNSTQTRSVKKIISHPQVKYSLFEFENDIVLVEVSSPLKLNKNVSAVCLPDKGIEQIEQLCIVAGWGISKPGESSKEQYLHYLPVPVIETSVCNSSKHYNGLISKDKLCAGYTDSEKSACYNDEGAPLMCFSDTSGWEIHGILSHHDNCGKSNHPSLYTSINNQISQWIINTIGHKPRKGAATVA